MSASPGLFRTARAALSLPWKRPRDEVRTLRRLARSVRRPFSVLLHRRMGRCPFLADVEMLDGRHVAYRVGTSDRHVVWSVLFGDEYRLDAWAPGPLGVVVDVGAHVGAFTLRVAPRAQRVLAIEPEPSNATLLRWNVRRAGHRHVTVRECAIGLHAARGRLEVVPAATSGHRLIEGAPAAGARSIEVDVVPLPDVLEAEGVASVDLLKLDIEGLEGSTLASLDGRGLDRVARVVLEYHPDLAGPPGWRSGEALAERLRERGFRVETHEEARRPGQGLLFAWREPGVPSLPAR